MTNKEIDLEAIAKCYFKSLLHTTKNLEFDVIDGERVEVSYGNSVLFVSLKNDYEIEKKFAKLAENPWYYQIRDVFLLDNEEFVVYNEEEETQEEVA